MYKTYRTSRSKPDPYVKQRCPRCHGTGQVACGVCGGAGRLLIGADIDGHPKFGTCEGCMGRKTTRCPTCGGSRYV